MDEKVVIVGNKTYTIREGERLVILPSGEVKIYKAIDDSSSGARLRLGSFDPHFARKPKTKKPYSWGKIDKERRKVLKRDEVINDLLVLSLVFSEYRIIHTFGKTIRSKKGLRLYEERIEGIRRYVLTSLDGMRVIGIYSLEGKPIRVLSHYP